MAGAPDPLVVVETVHAPTDYTVQQILHAYAFAQWLNRGKLVLATKPEATDGT